MKQDDTATAISDYVFSLGLGGRHRIINLDATLLASLRIRLVGKDIEVGIPESPDELDRCDILILDPDNGTSNSTTIRQLAKTSARPLLLLPTKFDLTDSDTERLLALGYRLPPRHPKGKNFCVVEHAEMHHKERFDVGDYWEKRYASNRGSGDGSHGRLALFKAHFINRFVKQNDVQSVFELGCGDGAQLALANYPQYLGLDISPTIIKRCQRLFKDDHSKRFNTYDPQTFSVNEAQSDLGLSLDVIYHLSNDEIYQAYLDHLFEASARFVIIYSNNESSGLTGVDESASYIRFRNFLDDVADQKPSWRLVNAEPNRFPFSPLDPSNTSFADFFIFEKDTSQSGALSATNAETKYYSKKAVNLLQVHAESLTRLHDQFVGDGKKIIAERDLSRQADEAHWLQASENAKFIREGLETVKQGLGQLTSQIDNEAKKDQEIRVLRDQVQQLTSQIAMEALKDSEIESLKDQIEGLHAQLETVKNEKRHFSTQFNEVSARYRVANARFRTASQEITALKAKAPKTGTIRRGTSRILRLATKSGRARAKAKIWQGLRLLKWKIIVPVATRFGVPYRMVSTIHVPTISKQNGIVAQETQVSKPENFTPPSSQSQEIAILGWPAPPEDSRTLVLAVMDEFTESCFGSDVRLLQPRPDNWYGLAQKYPPAAVFIESAWKGNGGSWQYRVGTYNVKPGRELIEMTTWARSQGIPTIFWNKEDPVHHEKFMEAASQVDHIFTTDAQMIESYRKRTGKQSVHALPFAAQPALHKPAPLIGRIPRSCFAGSWYGNRHAERGEAMKWLLKVAHRHGLDIFDRNFGTGTFPFPEEYQDNVRGSLPYLELCKEYSRYRLFLNVNSVIDSPTMFSRRVFELIACGTPVISTYAKGIEDIFQSNAVWMVRNEAEADEAIRTLLEDDGEWRRRSLAGIREIFSRHTYAHRLNSVFEKIGLNDRININPMVCLIAQAQNTTELEALFHFAETQIYNPFELLIECPSETSAGRIPKKVRLVAPGNLSLRVLDNSNVAGIGWISPRHNYGPNYLVDLINAMAYQPDARGWAKSAGNDAFAFGEKVWLSATIWKPDVFCSAWLTSKDALISENELFVTDAEEFLPNATWKAMQNV